MFFIPSPYLTLAKLGGSLPKYQGNEGSSEVNTSTLVDENNDGISDFVQPIDLVEGLDRLLDKLEMLVKKLLLGMVKNILLEQKVKVKKNLKRSFNQMKMMKQLMILQMKQLMTLQMILQMILQ